MVFINLNKEKKVYIASGKDSTYQIEFYELSDEENAIKFYNNNQSIFESTKGSNSSESSASLKNYSKYVLSTNGKYKVISRIDNTVIYCDIDDNYKSVVKEVLEEIDY